MGQRSRDLVWDLSYQQLCTAVRLLTIDVGTGPVGNYSRQLIMQLSKPCVKLRERLEVRCLISDEI